jgi:hypothetical protein
MGSLFIEVNSRMTKWRKKYITTPRLKILETGLYAIGTISTYTFLVCTFHECLKIDTDLKDDG